MKFRPVSTLVFAALAAACAGDSGETDAVTQEAALEEASPEEMAAAAMTEIREGYVTHYNLHHASMVADFYADDAVVLYADGTIADGREAIIAVLEEAMAASPTLSLQGDGEMVFGNHAVAKGSWSVETTPEGATEPTTMGGHYMTAFENVGGEWKINMVVTNFDAPPAEGFPWAEQDMEAPPDLEGGPVADMVDYFETHYNMGHPSMVAELYAEDAFASFPHQPPSEGRAAIEAAMTPNTEAGAQLTIHDVNTTDLGDGWYLDVGWYELEGAPTGPSTGTYMVLAERSGEGLPTIHWHVGNATPDGM